MMPSTNDTQSNYTNGHTQESEFDYFQLSEVDPTFKPLEVGPRTLQLLKLEPKIIEPKKGKHQGEKVLVLNGSFLVINDETYSGRRLYNTFWLTNSFDQKSLRRLSDGVGIPQEPGEGIKDWAVRMSQSQPTFKVFVDQKIDGNDGSTNTYKNEIKWANIQAA
jgi:hypothetical protein